MTENTYDEILKAATERPMDVLRMEWSHEYEQSNAYFDVLAIPGIGGSGILSIHVLAKLSDGDTYEKTRVESISNYIRFIEDERSICPSELRRIKETELSIAHAVSRIFGEELCTGPA